MASLRAASRAGQGRCETNIHLARMLKEANRAAELLGQTEQLIGQCEDSGDQDALRRTAAEAALLDVARGGDSAANVARAKALIAAATDDARTSLPGSALRLEIALLEGDSTQALQSWRDYFWLHENDLPPGVRSHHGPASTLFARGLAPAATPEEQLRLLDLLVRTGFARPAASFASAHDLANKGRNDRLWIRASAYLEARRQLESELVAANRRIARGRDPGNIEQHFDRLIARLVEASGVRGERMAVLRDVYGLFGYSGQTGGFPGVHLGHIVEDDRRTIVQYGNRASASFIVVDNMLANGFQTWIWDGDAAVGGWTDPGPIIVQVRPEWTGTPRYAWRIFSDPTARARFVEDLSSKAARDLETLRRVEVATLPGLADRLHLQAVLEIGARVRREAGTKGDLRRAFLEEYWRGTFRNSMLAHGRPARHRSRSR